MCSSKDPSSQSNYIQISTPKYFRDAVVEAFPRIGDDVPCMLLLGVLLFSASFDSSSGWIAVPSHLSKCLRPGNKQNNDFSLTKLIRRFERIAFPLEVKKYSHQGGKCNRINPQSIPTWLLTECQKLNLAADFPDRVDWQTGSPTSDKTIYFPVSEKRFQPKHESIAWLIEHLNSLDSRLFATVSTRASEMLAQFELGEDPTVAQIQFSQVLAALQSSPKSTYRACSTTARITPIGSSVLHLPRAMRDEILADRAKIDLKRAQLAIASYVLHEPWVKEWAYSIEGFWSVLVAEIINGVEGQFESVDPDLLKNMVKTCVYAVLYGATENGLLSVIRDESRNFAMSGALSMVFAGLFLRHCKVTRLIGIRNSSLKAIESGAADVVDAFGNVLASEGVRVSEADARSILAVQMQSYELAVLIPAVTFAHQTALADVPPLYVTEWLHDGIWVHCEDPGYLEQHCNAIGEVIQNTSQDVLKFAAEVSIELPKPKLGWQNVGSTQLAVAA